ncbi:MAG TPA: hypothetical protein VIE47_00620 [Methylocystis sp.]|jgi:hypothetical protein
MAQAKHVSKVKRSGNAVKVLGIAGASLAASASGSTAMMMMDTTPFEVGNPDQAYTLNDEELSDVSLATFHFFDEEALGTIPSGIQLARGCGCGHGCGGGRGCGGRGFGGRGFVGRGCGGRGCGGGWGGCGGCGGWYGWGGGCCLSWGGCYIC